MQRSPQPRPATAATLEATAELALRLSEARYRRLFETAQDGILLLNADTAQIEDVNPYLIDMLGYTHAEFLGKKLWEVGPFADVAQSKEMFAKLQTNGYVRYANLPLKAKAGERLDVEFVSNTYDCEGITVIQCNIRNITARTAAETQARQRTRLYAALSACNQAVVHCVTEEDLFATICRIAVQLGGMKMAWIGMADTVTHEVRPAASFGDDVAYLREIPISASGDPPFGHGPTGTAIRQNRPVWCQEFLNDVAMEPWRERGARAGWGASASLPLHRDGAAVGAFSVYSVDANAFDESTRSLLLEIASDVSFALDSLARESHRRQTDAALQASEGEFRTLAEAMPQLVWIARQDGHNSYFNQHWMNYTGLTLEQSLGTGWSRQLHPNDQKRAALAWRRATATSGTYSLEARLRRADGVYRWWLVRGVPQQDAHGGILKWFGTCTDIHDLKMAELEISNANRALRESERRFSDMLENVQLISLMLDCEARVTYCNDYLLNLTGWLREEVIGQDWFEQFLPKSLHPLQSTLFPALLASLPSAMHDENEILTRSGERRLIRWNNSVLRSGTGDVIGTASIGEDITERKAAEDRIRYLNRVLAIVSGVNSLIVRVRNRDELFGEACEIAVRAGAFRMSWVSIVDEKTGEIVPVASAGKDEELLTSIRKLIFSREMASTTMIARAVREKRAIVSNDSQNDPQVLLAPRYAACGIRSLAVFPLLVSGKAAGVFALYASEIDFFHDDELKLLTDLASSIAFAIDHIDKQERLEYLAYYDPLTGLANRSLFLERVATHMHGAVSGAHKLALFLIDLERFRNINDSLGRPTGDALLKQVAEWLTSNVGDVSLLARLGMDHFAVVMPEVKSDGSVTRHVIKSMDAFLQHPFHLNGAVFRISAKVGVALFPDDGADVDTLFRNAEVALKKAKVRGDRFLFYSQKMTAAVAGKLTLENQLRDALEKGEFVLHYQPKMNVMSGKLTSAEALIRWNDPRTGLVAPGRFIPILEETGLIYEVGRWALRKAVEDYLRWRAAGLDGVRIAVNVSPLQLRNRDFTAEIEQAVGIDARAAGGLELEITESLIMEDVKHSIVSLQAIRAMGVTIAIDDFGTGFSSLSYLSKLPVDTLKIDRSFIIDMTTGSQGLSLVSTIISLAHGMTLKVVAEGVETEEQSRLLRLLSCDEMQGFLFSKPVPVETFETEFLRLPASV